MINDGYSVLARLGRMGPGGAGESKGVKWLGPLGILTICSVDELGAKRSYSVTQLRQSGE